MLVGVALTRMNGDAHEAPRFYADRHTLFSAMSLPSMLIAGTSGSDVPSLGEERDGEAAGRPALVELREGGRLKRVSGDLRWRLINPSHAAHALNCSFLAGILRFEGP